MGEGAAGSQWVRRRSVYRFRETDPRRGCLVLQRRGCKRPTGDGYCLDNLDFSSTSDAPEPASLLGFSRWPACLANYRTAVTWRQTESLNASLNGVLLNHADGLCTQGGYRLDRERPKATEAHHFRTSFLNVEEGQPPAAVHFDSRGTFNMNPAVSGKSEGKDKIGHWWPLLLLRLIIGARSLAIFSLQVQ